MIAKLTIAVLLIASISARHYAMDVDYNIREIKAEEAKLLRHDPTILGTSQFLDDQNTTGWLYYYSNANPVYPDWLQMFTTGFMEGYLTYNYIWQNYENDIEYFKFQNEEIYSSQVSGFITTQLAWISAQILANPTDDFWGLVNATFSQQVGLYNGYIAAIAKNLQPHMNLTFEQFYLLTYLSDLPDVISHFNAELDLKLHTPKCSFLAKLLNDSLITSHTTWDTYTGLMRTYKVLEFNLKNDLVTTERMSFSSMPGQLTSQDDFYIMDDNKFVTETTLISYNQSVFSWIHPSTLPYWIRITVANLAYVNQEQWAFTYFNHRSGTYNNMWIVVDYNQYNNYKDNLKYAKNIIWYIEEFYVMTSAIDVTQQLLVKQGYAASYNVPYNLSIAAIAEDPTNYTNDPRAILFAKYAPGIKNLEQFEYVMRLNNYSDTHNYCQAISSRCDLNPNTTFPWGALDAKVTADWLVGNHEAWLIAGPSSENLTPFTWNNWKQFNMEGMPTTYAFDWVFMDPAKNFSMSSPLDVEFETIDI